MAWTSICQDFFCRYCEARKRVALRAKKLPSEISLRKLGFDAYKCSSTWLCTLYSYNRTFFSYPATAAAYIKCTIPRVFSRMQPFFSKTRGAFINNNWDFYLVACHRAFLAARWINSNSKHLFSGIKRVSYRIFKDFAEPCRILQNLAESCRILQNLAKFCRIL